MFQVIAICGLKRAGKDTIADIFESFGGGYTKKNIAGPLKAVCKLLFDFTHEQLNTDEKDIVDERLNITPRRAMQYIGTDMMQYQLDALLPGCGRTFWIDNFINKNQHIGKMIIADLRFVHEYKALKEKYGDKLLVIRVVNSKIVDDCAHSSEQEWKEIPFNVLINNNSTMAWLQKKIAFLYVSIC